MLIWNLGMILRIAMKVKMNVLLASLPPVLVLPFPVALRILVEVLMLLGMGVLIILLIMTLR
jgi:hypothetical protein